MVPPLGFLHEKNIALFCPQRKVASTCNLAPLCYSDAMGKIAGLKGMRHIALKVRDVARSKKFYQEIFGMDVVWEPDPQNVYLSSGCDNIALHQVAESFATGGEEKQLDHLGFVVETIERVKELESEFIARGVSIVHSFKIHRDGSASFYCADPDGIVIQLLYEPQLSLQAIK
jgi:catechol 2,3-dioxygenase-like lactoylglutathione lyase family enzyme